MGWIGYVLVVVFGSSTWLAVNGVWVELPLLVERSPQQWGLPAFLAVILQLACVGPFFYGLAERFAQTWLHPKRPLLISVSIAFAAFSLLLLAIFWPYTAVVSSQSYSLALFLLFFALSLVSTTSNVLFLPFMATFRPQLMTAYFIGMGVSAFVPSVLSLIQGASRYECIPADQVNSTNSSHMVKVNLEPNFGVSTFFGLLTVWMCVALTSFVVLMYRERSSGGRERTSEEEKEIREQEEEEATEATPMSLKSSSYSKNHAEAEPRVEVVDGQLGLGRYLTVLGLVVWVNALMNGFLPAVQSFSCLPYGPLTYHLAVALSNMANPVACFVPMLVPVRGRHVLVYGLVTVLGTAVSGWVVGLAGASPSPPLKESVWGGVACVVGWTVAMGVLAYLRAAMAEFLRESSSQSERRLFWYGVSTQLGAFLGSVLAFFLVNVQATAVFKAAPQCS